MGRKLIALAVAPLFALGMAACDVDQTEEAEAPDVEVREGQLPEYDVEAAEVEVRPDTQTITVPEVDVQEPQDDGRQRP